MPENLCYLVAEGGQHLLYSERGELIQGVIKTHTIDDIDCVPVARVTMLVKLSSKEDMEKDVFKNNGGIVIERRSKISTGEAAEEIAEWLKPLNIDSAENSRIGGV